MLARTAHLPEVEFGPGDTVTIEGGASGEIWVLVSGTLTVSKGGELVNSITRPGAIIGEISVLLETRHGATVTSTGTSRLRVADDGRAFLDGEPELMRMVAAGLAERLNFVSTYLADLKHQYGDTPGLSMVTDVLSRLSTHQAAPARPGSARDPDPEY
jgi:CRP/FNR family cyclic AMP-dependent transcriptional regulator